MKRRILVPLVCWMAAAVLAAAEPPEKLAEASAGGWLALVDSEKYAEKSAVETVVNVKEKQGEWRVAGYFIR